MEKQEAIFPRQATARRWLLQSLVALVGWAVFLYWWWLVFQRVVRSEVVFTAIFIAVTTAIAIPVTALWSLHNKRIHRRKGARTQVRSVRENYSRDTLLRTISFDGALDQRKSDSLVQIEVGENRKIYRRA